ncbi:MAG: hypothetical protein R3B48_03215 [Kofleriaceae bacterium]
MTRSLPLLLLLAFLAFPTAAHANLSKKVITAFKGKIVVSDGGMPDASDDKETIDAIKKAQLASIEGEKNADDVTVWRFSYAAFLSKTGPTSLKMVFYTDDKKKRYSADQRLDGVDPKSPVLVGDITISEDDGLSRGQGYIIKLIAVSGGKETTLASTTLKMN